MHESVWSYLIALGFVGIMALVFWGLGKLFPRKVRTVGGNALMRAEVFYNPSREHVIEAREHEETKDEESGDPPETGI